MTLANIANSRYGTTQTGAYTVYMGPSYGDSVRWLIGQYESNHYRLFESNTVICGTNTNTDTNSALNNDEDSISPTISGGYRSSSETSATTASTRDFLTVYGNWLRTARYGGYKSLCVGD